MFNSQERKISLGLLVMRIGLAAMLLSYTVPKLIAGSEQWSKYGALFNHIALGIPLEMLGLAALILQAIGGLSLLTGYLFRISSIVLTVLYGFLCLNYLNQPGYHTLTLFSLGYAFIFISLVNTGPGRYAVSLKVEKK